MFSGLPGGLVVKNLLSNAGDTSAIPGSGRSPGVGNGYPLQYSCLESSMNRGAWWATLHGVAKSWTWLSNSTPIHRCFLYSVYTTSLITVWSIYPVFGSKCTFWNLKKKFYCNRIDLQCCVDFKCMQSESVIHIHIYSLFKDSFPIIAHCRVWSIVPCAIQYVLTSYLFYI